MARAVGTQFPKPSVVFLCIFDLRKQVCICKECVLIHQQHISSGCCVYSLQLRGVSLRLKHTKVSKAFLWVSVL